MADEDIKIKITADDKASGVLNNVGKSASGLSGILGPLAKIAGVAVVAGFGAMAVGAVKSINAFVEAERASRQLEHAVVDISKGTKEQAKEIENLTLTLQRKAGIDADALNAGAAQLSTFGLQTKSVIGLTKSLADFTVNQKGLTATTDDYIGSANIMAKALNGQFGVLQKMGIRFTEAQIATITFGTETEKVAAIVEGLNQNLRETTDTIADTYEAKLAIISQSFGDLQESIGRVLVGALKPFADEIAKFASSEDMQKKFDEIGAAIGKFIEGTIRAAQQMIEFGKSVGEFVNKIMEQLKPTLELITIIINEQLTPAWNELKRVIMEQLWPALQQLWASLQPFMPLLEQFGKLVGIAVVASILILVQTLILATTTLAKVLTVLTQVATFISGVVLQVWKNLEERIVGVVNAFKSVIEFAKRAADAVSNFSVKGASSSIGKAIGFRAEGGPVSSGSPYIVGEKGPELFVPNGSGNIVPNNRLSGGAVGGINIHITGTFLSENAAERLTEIMINRLKLELRI